MNHNYDPPGGQYAKDQRLSNGKRPDAFNPVTQCVRELKPNNPKAIARGLQQLANYADQLANDFGGNWTKYMDTYDPDGTCNYNSDPIN